MNNKNDDHCEFLVGCKEEEQEVWNLISWSFFTIPLLIVLLYKLVQANRSNLENNSPVFRAMFLDSWLSQKPIAIVDISLPVFREFVK